MNENARLLRRADAAAATAEKTATASRPVVDEGMNHFLWITLSLGLACAGACGDSAVTTDAPTTDERDSISRGGLTTASVGEVMALADSLFDFDPTLDPSKSATENAQAVQTYSQMSLGSCGSAMLAGTTVTVAFGTSACTLPNGTRTTGTVVLAVSKTGSSISVALSFTNVTVNGRALSGSAMFVTSNGSTFAVTGNVTTADGAFALDVQVVGAASSTTVSGTVTETSGGATTTLQLTSVRWTRGACYPDSGSMVVTRPPAPALTVMFDATTASTGKVTIKQGRRTYPATLPAYGSCPRDSG